jgi:hypothetical protein
MLHHPDEGRLPELLHEYVEHNGLQPYAESTMRDPRLWAQLGLAADHLDFIEFVREYASQHPSSRAAIELLFLLESLARASLDALTLLVGTDPDEQLQWTRESNRRAYDVLVAIRDHYRGELQRRGLVPSGALTLWYDEVRLAILRTILRTAPDGYRAADARFLMGAIYWSQGRADAAADSWRGMVVQRDDRYAVAATQMLDEVQAGGTAPDAARVQQILDGEQGRWLMSSIGRLRRFGFHLDTF